jgi:hypothetical protein
VRVEPSWGEGLLGYVDYSYTGSLVNSDGIFEYDELTDELLARFGLKLSDIEIAHEQIKKIRNQAYNIPTKAAAVTANIFL